MLKANSSRGRLVIIALAGLLVTAVAAAAALAAGGSSTKGRTFYFIPKDTLNPYEVIADHGGKLALTALGEKQVVSSGTEDTAAAQQPAIQAAIQSHAAGIVIALRRETPRCRAGSAPGSFAPSGSRSDIPAPLPA